MVQWQGADQVITNMAVYGAQVEQAVAAIAAYFAPLVEAYAKAHAPWTDRTGNARQALHGASAELARGVVAIYLSGGMSYSKWLELRWSGRYAVILPTLETHYPQVMQMLRETFAP